MSDQNKSRNTDTVRTPRTARQLLKLKSKERGRSSKLERLPADRLERVLEWVRLGVYDHVAAMSLGICKTTWSKWMKVGEIATEEGEYGNIYSMFYLAVQEARSDARVLAEVEVYQGSPITWLKSVAPEEWSEVARLKIDAAHAVSGEVGFNLIPVETVMEGLSYLQELGYLAPTELGSKLLDVESEPSGGGNNKPSGNNKPRRKDE